MAARSPNLAIVTKGADMARSVFRGVGLALRIAADLIDPIDPPSVIVAAKDRHDVLVFDHVMGEVRLNGRVVKDQTLRMNGAQSRV